MEKKYQYFLLQKNKFFILKKTISNQNPGCIDRQPTAEESFLLLLLKEGMSQYILGE